MLLYLSPDLMVTLLKLPSEACAFKVAILCPVVFIGTALI